MWDKDNPTSKEINGRIGCVIFTIVLATGIVLTFWGGVAYVAYHFISKLW